MLQCFKAGFLIPTMLNYLVDLLIFQFLEALHLLPLSLFQFRHTDLLMLP